MCFTYGVAQVLCVLHRFLARWKSVGQYRICRAAEEPSAPEWYRGVKMMFEAYDTVLRMILCSSMQATVSVVKHLV